MSEFREMSCNILQSSQATQNSHKCPVSNTLKRDPDFFTSAGRSTYLRIDLLAVWHNIQILQSKCANHTQVIAVIKANAYGHGSVVVATYLNKHGIFNFAVATTCEGKELRKNGVVGHIQIFGNCVEEEIDEMLEYNLTPTATSLQFIEKWAAKTGKSNRKQKLLEKYISKGTADKSKASVVIEVDTGMSRNGCQCEELSILMKACEMHKIPVHSIMTHFAQSWDDLEFTQEQLDKFLECTKSYRCKGIKIHAANSAAIMKGFALDLDFVRPGIAIYGLAPDSSPETAAAMQALGMRPALSWITKPTLIKSLESGRKVGYNQTYRLKKQERIATFSFGYADGYNRLLSGKGVLTDMNGKVYEVVGRVSMDAVTVRVDDSVTMDTLFYVIKDDYSSPNSASNMANMLDTIPYELGTSLSSRLPKVFVTQTKDIVDVHTILLHSPATNSGEISAPGMEILTNFYEKASFPFYQYPPPYRCASSDFRETCTVNAYILYKDTTAGNKMSSKRFRQLLSTNLVEAVTLARSASASSVCTPLDRLCDRHFVNRYDNSKHKPRCVVCNAAGKRAQTSFFCKDCNVALCVVPCFETYHTVDKYGERRQQQLQQ